MSNIQASLSKAREEIEKIAITDNISLTDTDELIIVDQVRLPNELVYKPIPDLESAYQAIKKLEVRGAPAIGIFAGYAMYITAKKDKGLSYEDFLDRFHQNKEYLNSSRPTAVNLSWALKRMEKVVTDHADQPVSEILKLLRLEARKIHEEDIGMCLRICENGLSLLKDGDGVLTHCNAGPLATSFGTAQGPFLLAKARGMNIRVYADETRPLLQGARLTSYELMKAGVDVTLICDNMASLVMKNGWINACFVGCDRIAANGDVANKIGTSGVAILAKHYGIPVYSLGPTSTIDMNCPDGDHIQIELRDPDEIRTMWYEKPMAPEGVKCYNPSFDVTDHSLLAGIVTEKGIVYPPFDLNLKKLFDES